MLEFIINGRPISLQGGKQNKKLWKNEVHKRASEKFKNQPNESGQYHLSVVCIYDESINNDRPDTDNIIKQISDSLNGIVYKDDKQVISVDAHIRPKIPFI